MAQLDAAARRLYDAVGGLKAQPAGVLAIMGSSVLIGALMAAGLIDEDLLMIHPLVLGTGRRLFPPGVQASLRLTGSDATARRGDRHLRAGAD